MRKENLLNQTFNRLTVIGSAPSRNKKTFWLCQCACGNQVEVRADALKSGKTKSCGCLNTETRSALGKSHIADITNQRFGKLTALQRTEIRRTKSLGYDWLCQCDCGNQVSVPITYLRSHNNLSCGCLKKSLGETLIENILKKNNILYEKEKSFQDLGLLRFDFYLPKLNILIEFDGPQHYSATNIRFSDTIVKHDQKKNQWCLENNIKLIRIPYDNLLLLQDWTLEELLDDKRQVTCIDHYNNGLNG